jgi:4-amino-4-deoxy-L-arabinose transferase-like glycosyltransferase
LPADGNPVDAALAGKKPMNPSLGSTPTEKQNTITNASRWWRWISSEWLIFLAIMLFAIFLFFYRLPMIPSELNIDEWSDAYDALDMIENGYKVFSPINYGREMLFAYLVSIGFRIFGAQDIVLRGIGATAGVLTVGASYFLAKEMFRREYPHQVRWIAALTSLGLVVSFWQLMHLRMGRRHTLLPLFITLALYLLWRGFNKGSRWSIVTAGLFIGIAMHTYPVSRFVPVAIFLFLIIEGVIQWLQGHPKQGLWRQYWLSLLSMFVITGAVFLPLGLYFVFDQPDQFLNRANQVSVFSDEFIESSTLDTIWNSVSGNLLGLFWHGDEDSGYNIPGKPMFGPLMFAAFLLGFGFTLRHYRQPNHLFLFLWCFLLMVPAFLVADRIPAFKRSVGIIPVINIVLALGWVTFAGFVLRWRSHPRLVKMIAVGVPLLTYLTAGIVTYRDYFLVWGPSRQEYDFVLMYEDIAREMKTRGQADELWIFPQDPRNFVRRYYGLNNSLIYSDLPPRSFITTDEQDMFGELTEASRGLEQVVLVDVENGQEWQADPKEVFPFLLEKFGTLQRRIHNSDQNYTLRYYQLDSSELAFQAAEQWQPVDANFGEHLNLAAAAFGDASGSQPAEAAQVPSGETLWVTLQWQARGKIRTNYQVSLRLTTATGYVVAQVDRLLLDVQHRPTSQWEQGERVTDYYLLPLETGTVPGEYALEVRVYRPESGSIVPPDTPSSITPGATTIAQVPVLPSITSPTITPANPERTKWSPGLYLEGTNSLPESIQPGGHFSLALVWSSESELAGDQRVNLALVKSGVLVAPLVTKALVGGDQYRTSQWRAGEVIQQWLTLQVPTEITPGSYDLRLEATSSNTGTVLGSIQVNPGRPHQFEPPSTIEHPMDASFGAQIKLLGYDLAVTDRLNVTLYWQALGPIQESYKVFVHVLSPEGGILMQKDQIPLAGEAQTTTWLTGEVIVDSYQISMPSEAVPPGDYRLAIGLYHEITSERLRQDGNGNDSILLPQTIPIGG